MYVRLFKSPKLAMRCKTQPVRRSSPRTQDNCWLCTFGSHESAKSNRSSLRYFIGRIRLHILYRCHWYHSRCIHWHPYHTSCISQHRNCKRIVAGCTPGRRNCQVQSLALYHCKQLLLHQCFLWRWLGHILNTLGNFLSNLYSSLRMSTTHSRMHNRTTPRLFWTSLWSRHIGTNL